MNRKSIIQLALLLLLATLAACQPGSTQPPSLPTKAVTQAANGSGTKPSKVPRTLPATVSPYPASETQPVEMQPSGTFTATATITPTGTSFFPIWTDHLPILLESNQDLTFGPGQAVSVYAQGFQPGESIAVALIHEIQGVVFNKTAQADALGHVQTARRLTKTAQEKDALPTGRYTYQLSGASQVQKFTFQVDYQYRPETNGPGGCGSYPAQAVFEGHLAIFCRGLVPNTSYTLTAKQGEKYDAIITTSDPSGWIVYPLRLTSKTLGPGEWVFSLGKTTTQYGTPESLGFLDLIIPVLSPTEVHP